jgi:hypothetical protein
MTTAVEKRVHDLRQEINRLCPIRNVAYDDIAGLMKRRANAIAKLADFGGKTPPPSGHIRSFRARKKMSKKVYAAVMVKTKFFFKEKHAKKSHLMTTDVADTFKAIAMVVRYEKALTEKIHALVEELGTEYNSEAWNKMIHDKRLAVDTNRASLGTGSTIQWSPMPTEARGAAKAKAKAGGSNKRVLPPEPPTPIVGQLPDFHFLEVKQFKGPWSVICGSMKAEATVTVDGLFDMHEKYRRGWPGGWSSLRCKILANNQLRTFTANIDNSPWTMVEAALDPQGKSVVVWESAGKPQSIWTRTKRVVGAAVEPSPKPKARAKTQARNAGGQPQPLTPPMSASAGHGLSLGANSPTPAPAEWYTEIRDGRLMWTDGISAVPAEGVATDDNRQKTKMQF